MDFSCDHLGIQWVMIACLVVPLLNPGFSGSIPKKHQGNFMPNFLTPKSCFSYFTSSSITREAIALLCSKNSESKGKNFLWDPMGLPFFVQQIVEQRKSHLTRIFFPSLVFPKGLLKNHDQSFNEGKSADNPLLSCCLNWTFCVAKVTLDKVQWQ